MCVIFTTRWDLLCVNGKSGAYCVAVCLALAPFLVLLCFSLVKRKSGRGIACRRFWWFVLLSLFDDCLFYETKVFHAEFSNLFTCLSM
jgi:hypothetical protein